MSEDREDFAAEYARDAKTEREPRELTERERELISLLDWCKRRTIRCLFAAPGRSKLAEDLAELRAALDDARELVEDFQ